MGPGNKGCGNLFSGKHGPDGQTVPQRLGHCHDIRHHPQLLIGKKRPGPPDSCLDLVKDEEKIVLATKVLQALQILNIQGPDTALTL